MNKKTLISAVITAFLMGGVTLHTYAEGATGFHSKGRLEANDVVFDSRDFEVIQTAIEDGKVLAYTSGYEEGYSDCQENMTFTEYMRGKDFSSETINIGVGCSIPHVYDTDGVYTFLSDGILTGSFTYGSWQDWLDSNGKRIGGGRCLPATGIQLILYKSDGNVIWQTEPVDLKNRETTVPIEALAVSAGDKLVVTGRSDIRGWYYSNNYGYVDIHFLGTMTTFVKE